MKPQQPPTRPVRLLALVLGVLLAAQPINGWGAGHSHDIAATDRVVPVDAVDGRTVRGIPTLRGPADSRNADRAAVKEAFAKKCSRPPDRRRGGMWRTPRVSERGNGRPRAAARSRES